MNRAACPCSAPLNQKNHQERDDGRSGIDDELPGTEKPNKGPVNNQTIITPRAMPMPRRFRSSSVALYERRSNALPRRFFRRLAITCFGKTTSNIRLQVFTEGGRTYIYNSAALV
jgi:hypothetical protein